MPASPGGTKFREFETRALGHLEAPLPLLKGCGHARCHILRGCTHVQVQRSDSAHFPSLPPIVLASCLPTPPSGWNPVAESHLLEDRNRAATSRRSPEQQAIPPRSKQHFDALRCMHFDVSVTHWCPCSAVRNLCQALCLSSTHTHCACPSFPIFTSSAGSVES